MSIKQMLNIHMHLMSTWNFRTVLLRLADKHIHNSLQFWGASNCITYHYICSKSVRVHVRVCDCVGLHLPCYANDPLIGLVLSDV